MDTMRSISIAGRFPELDVAGSIPVSRFRINGLRFPFSTCDSIYYINAKNALLVAVALL
jgi:hypothetical protein